jgi:trans-aconitate methyltransferase
VADIGCGHGASTIIMARAFPASEFVGIDYHADSIATAGRRAREGGVGNLRFEVATARITSAGTSISSASWIVCTISGIRWALSSMRALP